MDVRSAWFAIALAGCGGGGGGDSKATEPVALDTPDAVFAAGKDRTQAMCACGDAKCRTDVSMRPDPFGEKARAAREKFTDAQKKAWKDIMKEWTACSLKK
jgi:hypothetical protein